MYQTLIPVRSEKLTEIQFLVKIAKKKYELRLNEKSIKYPNRRVDLLESLETMIDEWIEIRDVAIFQPMVADYLPIPYPLLKNLQEFMGDMTLSKQGNF